MSEQMKLDTELMALAKMLKLPTKNLVGYGITVSFLEPTRLSVEYLIDKEAHDEFLRLCGVIKEQERLRRQHV